jgi:hypothetical protein
MCLLPHSVKPWTYQGMSVAGALTDLKRAVDEYQPGQNGIDGGGFKIVSVRLPQDADDVGYLYVQFESAEKGYVDDMEFSACNGKVNVRTSSRLGFLDFGVNAIRFNWFAKKLASYNGWKTGTIVSKDHLTYFAQNDLTDADVGL